MQKKIPLQSPFLGLEDDISLQEAVDNQEPAKKETEEVRVW